MPQLDPSSFPPQLIWLAITFVVMYLIMSRVTLPRVGQVLEERQARIADNLDKAATSKREAEEAARHYEASIAAARQEAQGLIREIADASASSAADSHAVLADELAGKISEAEKRIEESRRAALENVRDVALGVSTDIAKRLVDLNIDADTAGKAVDAALKEAR